MNPPLNDDTPLLSQSIPPGTDAFLRMHLREIASQVQAGNKQNEAILRDLADLRGDMKLLNFRSDGHDKSIDDLDQTRRWAAAGLISGLVALLTSLLTALFHTTPKG